MTGSIRRSGLIAALFVTTVPATFAQDWTPEQRQVLDRVEQCIDFFNSDQFEGIVDCIHDDFSGWLYGDPVLRGKNNFLTLGRFYMDNLSVSAAEFRPLDVILLGNVAIVHYYTYTIFDGTMEVSRDRWTDILVNEEGTWRWIADHGGTDSGSDSD
ncbi:MAG: nuclear transport factor 2 family protein [Rhodothermia bacterium]|nr:nuclear transport factor 2 family protein [Rhodothermia bacterium]